MKKLILMTLSVGMLLQPCKAQSSENGAFIFLGTLIVCITYMGNTVINNVAGNVSLKNELEQEKQHNQQLKEINKELLDVIKKMQPLLEEKISKVTNPPHEPTNS